MSEASAQRQGLASHVRPGLIIGGKYQLEQEIGRGSMGAVFRAIHLSLGQRVAIKLISPEHLQSAEARKRFSMEAKAAAKLRSRHVVQVIDDGETPEGTPYIVLEFLEGETLEQRLEVAHDLPLAEAVRIVHHVGRALARAHAQGIVHRDLKPANIFLVKTEDEEDGGFIAKVLDFGIAKIDVGEKGTTVAGTVLGTPLFMSPEQVRSASSVDHRADLYSLGMCLFHMLTGDYAFYADNYSDILIGICNQPLPQLRAKAPWLPEAVEQWFQRACAKEPIERFQSADEMTEALQAAAGAPATSRHHSTPDGRIAPETLVGYAPPTQLDLERGPLSLARTQPIQSGFGAAPAPAAPIPIVIGGESRAGAARHGGGSSFGGAIPMRRDFRPLVLGVGAGLVLVGLLAILIKLLTPGEPAASSKTSGSPSATSGNPATTRPSVPAALPAPPPPPEPAPTLEPAPAPEKGGSSVGADTPPPKKKATSTGPKARPAPAAAAPRPKAASSDLGF